MKYWKTNCLAVKVPCNMYILANYYHFLMHHLCINNFTVVPPILLPGLLTVSRNNFMPGWGMVLVLELYTDANSLRCQYASKPLHTHAHTSACAHTFFSLIPCFLLLIKLYYCFLWMTLCFIFFFIFPQVVKYDECSPCHPIE